MKKIFLIIVLLFTFTVGLTINAKDADKFYTIVCNPGEDSATEIRINWHTDENVTDSYVVYTKKDDTNWENAQRGNTESFVNRAFQGLNGSGEVFMQNGSVLSNLESGTEYMYKITDGTLESDVRYFKTSNSSFSFIWSSDFHAYYDNASRLDNATATIEKAINLNGGVDFILNTGDYVAHGGTYKWWKQVSSASWIKNYMFASTIGNHDWMTSKGTTVDLGASHSFFSSFQNNPKNGYAGQENVCYYFYYGDALFIVLNTEEYTEDQYKWCESVLQNANSQYIFLVQHYQAFNSNGKMNVNGYTRWHELCDKYGVDIFFTGNSHVYIRTKSIYDGVESKDNSKGTVYMVAPSSDGERGVEFKSITQNKELIEYAYGSSTSTACSIVNVTESGVTTRLINTDGSVLDYGYVNAKRPASNRTTRDISDVNKEELESKIKISTYSKDITKLRLTIDSKAYDTLRAIKVSDESGKVYYYGKTIKDASFMYIEGVEKGLLDLKLELYYYDNIINTLKFTIENVPKWGKLSNVDYTIADSEVKIKWNENITLDTVKCLKIYQNGEYLNDIELGKNEYIISNINKNEEYDITILVVDSDDTIIGKYPLTIFIEQKTYNVKFYDMFDNIIKEEEVIEGECATAPEINEIDGYNFIKWDVDFTNITNDLIVKPVYEKEEIIEIFKVTFLDIEGNIISEQKVEKGKDATSPIAPSIDDYTFSKWDVEFTNVNSDLIVKPIYVENIKEENIKEDDSGCNSGTILFTSLVLLGLCFIRRKRLF